MDFSSNKILHNHKKIYTGITTYKYSDCEKIFISVETLIEHTMKNHMVREISIFNLLQLIQSIKCLNPLYKLTICSKCGEEFISKETFEKHEKMYNIYKYPCSDCKWIFFAV